MATPNLKDVPNALGKKTVIYEDGDTQDIMEVIFMGERRFQHYGKEFCKWANKNFEATEQGLRKLWDLVHHSIKYEVDPDGDQDIKTPPALAEIRKGDCKSKTLFVNAVLRCIGVPYIIRFTAYGMDKTIKHVYTIAFLNGRKIIMDTVNTAFNQEALWGHKQDFDMAKISLIEGLPEDRVVPMLRNKAYCMPVLSPEQEIYYEAKEKALALWDEIQQKKKEIPVAEPIEYQNITSGVASLKLLQRELDIIRVMKPEYAGDCKKGLDMIQRAIEGDYCITGSVSPYLNRYAHKIIEAKNLIAPANSYGLATKFINEKKRAGSNRSSIGAVFPAWKCLNSLWLKEASAYSYSPLARDAANGFCQAIEPSVGNFMFGESFDKLLNPPPGTSQMDLSAYQAIVNKIYYGYGSATNSRVKLSQFWTAAKNVINNRTTANGVILPALGGSHYFQTKAEYDDLIEALNQASGVTGRWLDNAFSIHADPNGTLGSGMFYSFADKIPTTGISGFVAVNDLPTQVQIKKSLEDGFINSCVNFSGVSFANVQQLARNGVLCDSGGEQPEYTLGKLWRLSNGGTAVAGIGFIPALIAAIAAAIVAIVGAIGAAVAQANAAAVGSADIDTNLSASSQFRPPNLNQSPNEGDWPLKETDGGSGGGGGSSSMLPLAAAGVLGFLALNEK